MFGFSLSGQKAIILGGMRGCIAFLELRLLPSVAAGERALVCRRFAKQIVKFTDIVSLGVAFAAASLAYHFRHNPENLARIHEIERFAKACGPAWKTASSVVPGQAARGAQGPIARGCSAVETLELPEIGVNKRKTANFAQRPAELDGSARMAWRKANREPDDLDARLFWRST